MASWETVEHISAAEAKPPKGPDDGVGLALADAAVSEEAPDGDPADPAPVADEHPDNANAASRTPVK
ncbi:hypothetical protein AB6813_13350 [bacterium RCC_150]